MFAPSLKKKLIWVSFSSQSFLPSKTVSSSNAKRHKQDVFCEESNTKLLCSHLLWRVRLSNTKLLCSHLLWRTGLKGEWRTLMFAPSLKKKLIWVSFSSQSFLPSKTVSSSNAKRHKQDVFCEESNTKLLCSHLLWRTGLKGEALMFAPSMKNRLKRWSSYVRTFFEEEAYLSVFLIAVLPPI